MAKKQRDPSPEHPIPARSRQANDELVDLTAHYTAALDDDWLGKPGASLAPMPKGVQVLADVAFDVRGLIQLAGQPQSGTAGSGFPEAVTGIRVNRSGRRLHFLHAAVSGAEAGAEIGRYVLHYTDGRTQRVPLIYGRNIRDWWAGEGDPVVMTADVAWAGKNEASRGASQDLQICRHTINNPFPDEEIETIDFVSANAAAAPFLIALTVERNDPAYEGFHTSAIDRFCPIPPRTPEAGPDLVDLSDHYTSSLDDNWFHHAGHDLRDLPHGVHVLGGVAYDLRGLVQLSASKMLEVTGTVFPEAVTGIAVNRTGARLHFLQGCFWQAEMGAKVGDYVIHYADGQTRTAPILYGRNIRDWWIRPGDRAPTEAEIVWRGANPATRSMGMITQLSDYTWGNPRPDVEISTIDFVSDLIEAGPFLVALTLTP